MSERWVVNASPLILLAKVGHADLLVELADEIAIPEAVADEIRAGPEGDPARSVLDAGRFRIAPVGLAVDLLGWDLGAGETAVLSLALAEPGWTVILDDAAARRCARSYGLPIKGTLAIVILAKQRGLIDSAAAVLGRLRAAGIRLDDRLIAQILPSTTSETWEPNA